MALGDISFDGTPHLVLGRRRGKRDMQAKRVVLHENVHESLWELCLSAVERARTGSARSYEPNAELEVGEEYFLLNLDEIPEQADTLRPARARAKQESEDENPDRTAALIRALRDVAVLDTLNPHDLPEYADVIFYSIAWQQPDDSWVHFIRKINPRRVFKPGRQWFGYGDTLKRIDDPAMVIDDLVDIILTSEHLAAFSGTPLRMLFTDVHIVLQDVPKYVEAVAKVLDEQSIGITSDAKAALLTATKKKVSFAARLYRLQERLQEIKLDVDKLAEVLGHHSIDIGNLINDGGRVHFEEKDAGLFLDVVDGRFFKDDWTGESRRADRFSRWQPAQSS
ncbi:hypothetical protein ACQP2K_01475 [Microbispora siamensis]